MTLVMGVLNITPDSFSDGGRWCDPEAGIAHARRMVDEGAAIIDIGGESTRPGAVRPSEDEELARVMPVVEALAPTIPVSVDTMRASTAREAISAGARIINDVSGGMGDPEMLAVVAASEVDYVCQHWRGYGDQMDARASYHDVVDEVISELMTRVGACRRSGIEVDRIIIDPGLGFAKTAEHDWRLLAAVDQFTALGYRVLVGASRKRFVGSLLSGRPVGERDAATAAISTWCAFNGVWAVRTHEISAQVDAVVVGARLRSERAWLGGPDRAGADD